MSWSEFLSLMLESSNKVDRAAIFNIKGQPLATTEGLQISEADGRALLLCMRDPARSLTRITLDGMDFRCFQGNPRALVGKATNTSRRVLVARLTDEVLIVVIGNSTGHGSFLYEVQHNLDERARRLLVPSQGEFGTAVGGTGEAIQQNLPSPTSPLSPILSPPPKSPPASQNQVLVQLHD